MILWPILLLAVVWILVVLFVAMLLYAYGEGEPV